MLEEITLWIVCTILAVLLIFVPPIEAESYTGPFSEEFLAEVEAEREAKIIHVADAKYDPVPGCEPYKSGMLCDKYREEDHEQETIEETESEPDSGTAGVLQECDQTESEQTDYSDVPAETEPETVVDEQVGQNVYELIAAELNVYGVGWWYPYAVAQMMAESGGDPYAENPNGLDKGLFQYRVTYWTEPESIFDVRAQIRRYVREVTARINAGLSIEEIISRHYTSDWVTEINWEYVNHVLSRMK